MTDHRAMAEAWRTRTRTAPGVSDPGLRVAALERGAGGPPMPQPFDALAHQIGEAAYRVTDGQVDAVRARVGSDKATFEIVMAATIGAGLARWDAAIKVLDEADHAAG